MPGCVGGCQQHQDYYRLASVCWKPLRCLFKDGAKSCAHICITFATQHTLLAHFVALQRRSCFWAFYGGGNRGHVNLLSHFCLFVFCLFIVLFCCLIFIFLLCYFVVSLLSFCFFVFWASYGPHNMGHVTLLSHFCLLSFYRVTLLSNLCLFFCLFYRVALLSHFYLCCLFSCYFVVSLLSFSFLSFEPLLGRQYGSCYSVVSLQGANSTSKSAGPLVSKTLVSKMLQDSHFFVLVISVEVFQQVL